MIINFLYPYRPPNGVSALFGRIAESLSRRPGLELRVIDYPDGFMARQLKPGGAVVLKPFTLGSPVEILSGEVLVLQGEIPYRSRRQLRIEAGVRMIYWQLHPDNFVPVFLPALGSGWWANVHTSWYGILSRMLTRRQMHVTTEFVKLLAERKSLFFMDETCRRTTEEKLGLCFEPPILLPVALDVPADPERQTRLTASTLHVAWVGRLYDFKIHILIATIREFARYATTTQMRIVFHVIGGGPKAKMLDEFEHEQDFFSLIRVADLERQALHGYLSAKIDLVAAMGTAALDGAAIGLPVILLDFSYKPIAVPYRFRWLFDTQGFDIGHQITDADADPTGESLAGLLAELRDDYAGIAKASQQYCFCHHSITAVSERFMSLLEGASLRFGDIPRKLWKKSLLRHVYELARH